MFTISCDQMKKMDTYTIEEIGIPSIVLMETAAIRVVENIDLDTYESFTIICGTGNNGGDGLAVARMLYLQDLKVDLYIIGDLNKGSKDFNVNLNIINNIKLNYTNITDQSHLLNFKESVKKSDLVIDAIFGIGLDRAITGTYYDVINLINKHSIKVLAVDLPSGLNGDSGKVSNITVNADTTVTFHQMKKGLLKNHIHTGRIIIADIGIPDTVTKLFT